MGAKISKKLYSSHNMLPKIHIFYYNCFFLTFVDSTFLIFFLFCFFSVR